MRVMLYFVVRASMLAAMAASVKLNGAETKRPTLSPACIQ
jgi:hypothetical protein